MSVVILALLATSANAASRHIAIIVDTSGSMTTNDRARYTMQLSQVLSDLVDAGDQLAVIRMPAGSFASCSAGPSSSIVLRLDPADRAAFKSGLDGLIQFNTGTYFAAPVRTAIALLPPDPSAQRMLLVIADAGGLGDCDDVLTRELLDLKRGGVSIAAINLGGDKGAFDRNPAFDFTTAALTAQGLIEAVALVYQRFLGAKHVQTGRLQNEISVDIAPFVNEAFLIVAADGPIGSFEQNPGNPASKSVDLNFRGGGVTRGLDGIVRGYRIARLERPAAGRWRFRIPGFGNGAGWMLLQDFAIGGRVVSSGTVPKGVDVPLEVELFDQSTGQKIIDTSKLPGLQVSVDVEGRKVTFHDDGHGGDKQAGDGIFTATTTFNKIGDTPLQVQVQSDLLDRKFPATIKVIDASWQLAVRSPRRVEVDRPVMLSVALEPIGSAATLHEPERVDVVTGGPVIQLRDDGKGADSKAGDRTFTGAWTPAETGTLHLDYVPVGGSHAAQASAPLEVFGRLKFGPSVPVQFGRIGSKSDSTRQLDLGSADVRGDFQVNVTTPFKSERSIMEIDLGNGWLPLGKEPQTVRLSDGGRKTWPLRLRVGECPDAFPAGKTADLVIAGIGGDGRPVKTVVPMKVEIVADPWLRCWWPILALILGVIVAGIIVHGYWVPSRFSPRMGVMLSPEEDLNEGFFHPIRTQRGTGSGFYRDARVYICQDFRLAGQSRNPVARLRADHKQVKIAPASGAAVWRQNADGEWEQIPPDESTIRFGDLFRNDSGTLFFELRNA